jgi:hypothetical protein
MTLHLPAEAIRQEGEGGAVPWPMPIRCAGRQG